MAHFKTRFPLYYWLRNREHWLYNVQLFSPVDEQSQWKRRDSFASSCHCWEPTACQGITGKGAFTIETLRYPFSVYGYGKVTVFVSTSRPLFTPEKRLGYRVAWWLVIIPNMKKIYIYIWKNIEKHGILLVPVRRNRGILRSLMLHHTHCCSPSLSFVLHSPLFSFTLSWILLCSNSFSFVFLCLIYFILLHSPLFSFIFLHNLSFSFVLLHSPLVYFILFHPPSFSFPPLFYFILLHSLFSFIFLHNLSFSFVLLHSPLVYFILFHPPSFSFPPLF